MDERQITKSRAKGPWQHAEKEHLLSHPQGMKNYRCQKNSPRPA
jgi:hypothetical protein